MALDPRLQAALAAPLRGDCGQSQYALTFTDALARLADRHRREVGSAACRPSRQDVVTRDDKAKATGCQMLAAEFGIGTA